MIRVFPRRTKWTPTDSLAFVGDPPLFRPDDQPVRISVAFTWDIPEAERLYRSWSRFYSDVEMGGPAFGDPGVEFTPGRFLEYGRVITSRGCPSDCPWCLAWRREGYLRELTVTHGFDVADNNLLACSKPHIEAVFEMLRKEKEPARFSGGLDARLLMPWHVDLLKTIRLKFAWFACDYPGALQNLERVADLMADFGIEKKRVYVLIGFNGESETQAERRLEKVYRMGFLPFAMLYRGDGDGKWSRSWRLLQRKWARPAAYRSSLAGPSNKRFEAETDHAGLTQMRLFELPSRVAGSAQPRR